MNKKLISEVMSAMGKRGGKASGPARMEKLTPEQRTGIAQHAAAARWGPKKKVKAKKKG